MKSYKLQRLAPERFLVWDLLRDTRSYYLNHHVFLIDFTGVEKVRSEFSAKGLMKPSYVAFMLFAISKVLPAHPKFNSYLRTFPTPRLALYRDVDICYTAEKTNPSGERVVALSILRNCGNKHFMQISDHIRDTRNFDIEKMPEHKDFSAFLRIPDFIRFFLFRLFYRPFPEKMRRIGGTCALTSVGKYGVDITTPLSPKTITFSLGRVAPRALVADGKAEARMSAYVTLTYDHRVADGAECAALGSDLRRFIENIGEEVAKDA